jgi:hypothetical protein
MFDDEYPGSRRNARGSRRMAQLVATGQPWNPHALSGLILWLRTDIGITLNAGNVSAWADQSGAGNSVTQATPGNQPAFVASGGPNNVPYLSLVGGANVHGLVGAATIGAQPLEYLIAARSTVSLPPNTAYLIDFSTNVNTVFQNSATNVVDQFDGTTIGNGVTVTIGSDFILDSFFSGASSQQTLNGGAPVSGSNPGVTAPSAPPTVGNSGLLTREWGGRIYEIAVYNRQLLAAERLAITRYMGARYGVTVP